MFAQIAIFEALNTALDAGGTAERIGNSPGWAEDVD
jgi:hypothetical protein